MDLKEALRDKLTDGELENLVTSFEVIGDVAIIEVPEKLEPKKEIIGETLMELNKHVRVVLQEISERKGEYRTRDYEIIAGGEDTETVHKEHGCRFKLDPRKVYFSEREGTERQRIADQVEEGEVIMAMFAGVGPFPIVIAKKKDVEKIYAVELNPKAYEYLKENVDLNKMNSIIEPLKGDVREICPDYFGDCDRVLMPLPKGSEKFLDFAVKCLKPEGGIVHYYSWSDEDNLYKQKEKILKEVAKDNDMGVEFLGERKVLPYAPGVWKVCIDAKFSK